MDMKDIPYFTKAKTVREVTKGFSHDKKLVIDEKYLVRIFSAEEGSDARKKEFETIKALSAHSARVPEAIEYGFLNKTGEGYMVLSYLQGVDGEAALPCLSDKEQYQIGFDAGKELKKLHKLNVPDHIAPWEKVKKKKSDRYLEELKTIPVAEELKEMLATYIKENEFLIQGRPNRFQHDDFHPSNLLIHNHSFSGIIDFQRMDWGDPVHDLYKTGFFSKQVSVPFSRGGVDGYLEDWGDDTFFWELYALYSAMHLVSALVWCVKHTPDQFDKFHKYSLEVIDDHNGFTKTIPSWYR
ncbi:aminoglycoside phosphotransferase family protein [Bacillus sp. H-16]|uniref:aminoglycoside phosphotransferase family protein n=1 Tax=Alteribacter salitolerans TaxID=2912333 RepID=UPI00196328A9|nr:aminoglycoside phosphotransferase family protein [Alteribacter salitolerans]MBM7097661.1 aminoglycoside phosphotransferase family protein [Alteribacter salitolerans]